MSPVALVCLNCFNIFKKNAIKGEIIIKTDSIFKKVFASFVVYAVAVAIIIIFISACEVIQLVHPNGLDANLFLLMTVSIVGVAAILLLRVKQTYKVIMILLLSFLIRLIWVVNVSSVPVSDFATIFDAANNFLEGDKGAVRNYGYLARFPHLVPMMVYVMGMMRFFGTNHIIAIKVVSLFLTTLNVYLLYRITAYYVDSKSTRLIAMGFAALFPPFISYCSTFCTENIAITFYLLSFLLVHKAINAKSKNAQYFFFSGCVLYISNMFRAIGVIFLIAYGIFIIVCAERKQIINIVALIVGYVIMAMIISSVLMSTSVIEQPLWQGKEPSFATLMLKGSNFEHHGMWNEDDARFVEKNLGNENLSGECFRIVGQRIREKGIIRTVIFYFSKFVTQWGLGDCNGTFWATMNTNVTYSYPLPLIFQLIYCAILFLAIFTFKSSDRAKTLVLPCTILCGIGVAFVLLETQGRYSLVASWLFIILAAVGIENIRKMNFERVKAFTNSKWFRYLFFGVITTIVNIVVYFLLYNVMHVANVISNIIAWFVSVLVAFVTNKLWVFSSKNMKILYVVKEFSSFLFSRVLTGVVDLALMWVGIDILHFNSLIMKVLANAIVIIINYVISNSIIFRKERNW